MSPFFEHLEALDMSWTLAINACHTPWWDAFWMFMSAKQVWIPLYVAVAALMIYRLGWKRGIIFILATGLCIGCIDQLSNLFKYGFERLRPCNDQRMLDAGLWVLSTARRTSYSFFSAHAANAMGFAICSLCALRCNCSEGLLTGIGNPNKPGRRLDCSLPQTVGVCLIIWAVLVGASRIFVGRHFLGDVLVGFVMGAAVASVISLLCCRILRRLSQSPQES